MQIMEMWMIQMDWGVGSPKTQKRDSVRRRLSQGRVGGSNQNAWTYEVYTSIDDFWQISVCSSGTGIGLLLEGGNAYKVRL